MNEVEVKVLECKESYYRKTLLKLGFKKVSDRIITQTYYGYDEKHPNKEITLRIRTENKTAVLTMKEKRKNSKAKSRKETDVFIDNPKNMDLILQKIGLKQDRTIIKRRISYKKENMLVEFDKHLKNYSFIPEFMEIESTNYKEILKLAKILELKENQLLDWTFSQLKTKYQK